jgi:hypothetical protein
VKPRRKTSRESSEQLDHLLRIREELQERLAKLIGGVDIIKVGGRPRRKGRRKRPVLRCAYCSDQCRLHRFADAHHRSLGC